MVQCHAHACGQPMGNEAILSSEQEQLVAQAGAMSRAGFGRLSTARGPVSRADMVKPAAARATWRA
jgi:hypothetical protein